MDQLDVLNRLLRLLTHSLPAYLQTARPWVGPGGQPAEAALARLAADQQVFARRVAEEIVRRRGRPDPGPVPAEFAAYHDLAMDYVLRRAAQRQQRDVEQLRHCVEQLRDHDLDLPLRLLAEDILQNAQQHLETLQQVAGHAA